MTENNLTRIKTSQSEIERENHKEEKQKESLIHDLTAVSHLSNSQNRTLYHCPMCQKDRVICPCSVTHQKHALTHTFNKKKAKERIKLIDVSKSTYEPSRSVPKITFSYNQTQSIHSRNHSFSVPKTPAVNAQWILRDTQTSITTIPLEEILYYPVVHNKFKYESPIVQKMEQQQKRQTNSSRKRIKRSFIDNSIRAMKDISTNESKEPMTPEQFKKLSEWLLEK